MILQNVPAPLYKLMKGTVMMNSCVFGILEVLRRRHGAEKEG